MLSFELSLRGHRVITDTGVFDYTDSPRRAYCRSTAAHNTVEIAGQSQAEFWDVFRVGQRGTVHDLTYTPSHDGFELSAWHDGYQWLEQRARHRRTFKWKHSGSLTIDDVVTCASPVNIVSRLHLHPACHVSSLAGDVAQVRYPAGQFEIRFEGPGYINCQKSPYFPQFNREISRPMIQWNARIERGAHLRLQIEHAS
jgi:uncharacterized heparinase superfamily protein